MRLFFIILLSVVGGVLGSVVFWLGIEEKITNLLDTQSITNSNINCGAMSDEAEQFLCFDLPQQAAWAYFNKGDIANGNKVIVGMEKIMRSKPVKIEKFGIGAAYSLKIHFNNGSKALFKPYDADMYCADCSSEREVAAYAIDRWLNLNLVPLTISYTADLSSVPRCTWSLPSITNSAVGNDYTQCKGIKGSLQFWVESADTADYLRLKDADKSQKLRFLDAVLGNTDRHERNWLLGGKYSDIEVAIDNNRAFRHAKKYYQIVPRYNKVEYFSCWQRQLDKICSSSGSNCSSTTLKPFMDKYRNTAEADIRALFSSDLPKVDVDEFIAVRPKIIARFDNNLNIFSNPMKTDSCELPPRTL